MSIYGALGRGGAAKGVTPSDPGWLTQRFPADQGRFQVRYVGKNEPVQSLTGDPAEGGYFGTTRTYSIANGRIVTDLAGTPIEIAVYKLGAKYLSASGALIAGKRGPRGLSRRHAYGRRQSNARRAGPDAFPPSPRAALGLRREARRGAARGRRV